MCRIRPLASVGTLMLDRRSVLERRRRADQEPLRVVDADLTQAHKRLAVLYELGDGLHSEALGDLDHRLDEHLVGAAAGHVADELPVDLDVVDRKLLEVGERPESGAEVIEGAATPEAGERDRELPGLP